MVMCGCFRSFYSLEVGMNVRSCASQPPVSPHLHLHLHLAMYEGATTNGPNFFLPSKMRSLGSFPLEKKSAVTHNDPFPEASNSCWQTLCLSHQTPSSHTSLSSGPAQP